MSMAGSTVAMDIADINKAGLLLLCFHWFSPTLLRMSCLKTEAWEQLRTQSPVATSGPHACVHTEGGWQGSAGSGASAYGGWSQWWRRCGQWCSGLRWPEPMVEVACMHVAASMLVPDEMNLVVIVL
jgi:hypothetical protein